MKKSKTMRVASGLLVLTLLSTCMVAGTFAKYTTSATGDDTARVAKWGVNITANGTTFAGEYATDDSNVSGTIAKSVVTANGGDGSDLVAPGTKGDMASMTLTGSPEVAVEVSYKGAFALGNGWTVDGKFYCPLKIKINDTTINGLDSDNKTDFENKVNAEINKYKQSYPAGTDLSAEAVKGQSLKVSWAWDFEGSGDQDAKQADEKDTELAGVANSTVTLAVTTTVAQID